MGYLPMVIHCSMYECIAGGAANHEVRDDMTNFWVDHSRRASTVEMMLDTDADRLGEKEIPEILSLLPDVQDKDVLELGAGIGYFE